MSDSEELEQLLSDVGMPSRQRSSDRARGMSWPGRGAAKRFDWERLVALTVHPLKVAIVEALRWVEEPLSASELTEMVTEAGYSLDMVIYHAGGLAKLGVLELTHTRRSRGARERFYFFSE